MNRSILFSAVGAMTASVSLCQAASVTTYRGACDASAAVALDKDHFVVGEDERNVLLVYKRGNAAPVDVVPVFKFLKTKEDKESDLEGAAAIGKRIYWISSHGTNKTGEVQERRRRFFATDIVDGATPSVKIVGQVYTSLVDDLSSHPDLQKYDLGNAAKRPPKSQGGLSIEGLAATNDGKLLIGFRNPVPNGEALVVPLENPDRIIAGERAVLGKPLPVKLDGQGIRSIEQFGDGYLIVAGAVDKESTSKLYRWAGKDKSDAVPVSGVDFTDFNPEALFAVPGSKAVEVLSDDGTDACKAERDPQKKKFRSMTVEP